MEQTMTFNLTQAAEAAGISVPVMRELAHRPGFPALRVGRRWVIPRDEFRAWLGEQARAQRAFEGAGNHGAAV